MVRKTYKMEREIVSALQSQLEWKVIVSRLFRPSSLITQILFFY